MSFPASRARAAELHALAESYEAGDRIAAGERLAALADAPRAEVLLRRLLLDADSVGVTAYTANALVEQADLARPHVGRISIGIG